MDTITDRMRKSIDEAMEKDIFSQFPQFNTKPKEIDVIEEIKGITDKLTTVILCNSSECDKLQTLADKASGFYKIIGSPYIEKGKTLIIEDEKLKRTFLQIERNKKQQY